MTTPAEPANGSTITAAMFDASCSAIRSSSSSASSAPVLRHAARERVRLVVSASCVCGRWSASTRLAERLAVADDAADGDAAEVDAVIALLAADQARLRALALRTPVRARHLERRVRGLGARAGEEHVVEARGRELLDLVRERERRAGGRTGTRARSRAWRPVFATASAISRRPWPRPQHHRPDRPSKTFLPSASV